MESQKQITLCVQHHLTCPPHTHTRCTTRYIIVRLYIRIIGTMVPPKWVLDVCFLFLVIGHVGVIVITFQSKGTEVDTIEGGIAMIREMAVNAADEIKLKTKGETDRSDVKMKGETPLVPEMKAEAKYVREMVEPERAGEDHLAESTAERQRVGAAKLFVNFTSTGPKGTTRTRGFKNAAWRALYHSKKLANTRTSTTLGVTADGHTDIEISLRVFGVFLESKGGTGKR